MPVYEFIKIGTENSEKPIITEVYIPITGDVNTYNGEDGSETGVWKRYWNHIPYLAQATKIDPYSKDSFIKATEKRMTFGEMIDLSKEMSNERASKDGRDEVREKMYKNYEKQHGVKHYEQVQKEKKEQAKKNLEKFGIEIEN